MGLFSKEKKVEVKKPVISEDDFATLKSRITSLELEFEALRNKVLRKIQEKRIDNVQEQKTTPKPGMPYYGG